MCARNTHIQHVLLLWPIGVCVRGDQQVADAKLPRKWHNEGEILELLIKRKKVSIFTVCFRSAFEYLIEILSIA